MLDQELTLVLLLEATSSNEKAKESYRKDDRAMRPIYGCPGVSGYAHGYNFSRNC